MDPAYLYQVPHIRKDLDFLLGHDPVFGALGTTAESLPWRMMAPGFPGLVRIVIGQQVSTRAAQALWSRFQAGIDDMSPAAVARLPDDVMRALGLSGQKARYIRLLAHAIEDGQFDPAALSEMSDDEVYAAVTALTGFGRWSAEMYLMFALARPDIWPAGDLGIQEGLRLYHKLETRPDAEQAKALGAAFAPHRTAASILLWHLKSRD